MAICNVFKELTKSNGTFFAFSQYAEDLTKHQSNNSYKVIPSKFICCDVDYSLFDNKTLPNLLQNNFENGCSFLRDKLLEKWTPKISKNLFWNEIGSNLLLANDKNSMVYCGDINIQSYSEQDNIGYNEIYCYIPNDAKKMEFIVTKSEDPSNDYQYNGEYICGYDSNDLDFTGLLDIKTVYQVRDASLKSLELKDYKYQYNDKYNIDLNSGTNIDSDSFKFNTVVVFYNISNGDKKIENIPLGMFVAGTIYEGEMSGEITKYVSNGDIYDSGTSYGLRICNRFVVSPNSTELQSTTVINSEEDGDYPALAQVMSAMVDSQSKMDEVINSIHNYRDGIKEHLAQFKNSRVNVPYILYVNNIPYWFINGKNTDVPVWGGVEALRTTVSDLNEKVNGIIKIKEIGVFEYNGGDYVKSVVINPYLLPGAYSMQEIGGKKLDGDLSEGNPKGFSLILRDYINGDVIDVINAKTDEQFISTRPFTLEICPVESEFLKTYYNSEDKESLKSNLQVPYTGKLIVNYPSITIKKITEKFTERDL